MSATMRDVLALADYLTARAEAEGIEIRHVSLHPLTGVSIYPAQEHLAPALAMTLGLTERHVMGSKNGREVEFFDGAVGAVVVSTHHELTPARVEQVTA